jgi:branched-chain amino acid transport system ATP-binding protein
LTGAASLLEVEGLVSGYGGIQILREVSLAISAGEIVALLGANGAGKTTLVNTLCQIVPAWSGTIRFDGRDLTHARSDEAVSAGVVQVPQGRRLFSGLSVRDNLLQGAFLRKDREGVKEDLAKIFALLPRLRERAAQPAGQLSGGEQQMCAIGRGLMARPKLLAIDELSLGLAPLVVEQLFTVLDDVRRSGTTVLLIEQDVQIALEHADRGYVLETGRIVQSGRASDLLEDPRIRQAYLGL